MVEELCDVFSVLGAVAQNTQLHSEFNLASDYVATTVRSEKKPVYYMIIH